VKCREACKPTFTSVVHFAIMKVAIE